MSFYPDRNEQRAYQGYPSRHDTLAYYLEDLQTELDTLRNLRPRDPMHADFDRYFYADSVTHYYDRDTDTPHTVQGLLSNIDEVKALIAELDTDAACDFSLAKELPGQLVLTALNEDYPTTPLAA